LIEKGYVQEHIEERRLSILCLKYLTLECFDEHLSEEIVRKFLGNGYYGFQEYASIHWADHLQALLPSFEIHSPDLQADFASSLHSFYNIRGQDMDVEEKVPEEFRKQFHHIQGVDYVEEMLQLLNYARQSRTEDETLEVLGDLGASISRARLILEKLDRTGDECLKNTLHKFYGRSLYKCPRHGCFYFHEGFPDSLERDKHVCYHYEPFCCPEPSCPRTRRGFRTEHMLKSHLSNCHPDLATFVESFPQKKPPQTYKCTKCDPPRDYTKADDLRIHQETHKFEQLFNCGLCGKSFVRTLDCARHEEKVHPGGKEGMEGSAVDGKDIPGLNSVILDVEVMKVEAVD
jgi:hypothetical protein